MTVEERLAALEARLQAAEDELAILVGGKLILEILQC